MVARRRQACGCGTRTAAQKADRLKRLSRESAAKKRLSLSESRARMEAVVDGAQPRLEHVSVNLCRREIRVTEHQLTRAQVRTTLEQMGRKRVSHDVRAERPWEACSPAIRFQDLPESYAA